ncbi:MAG: CapA family protein [Bacteroidales bacterium]|nr:CapA family protein [Bacteroidales bacterium]
MRLLIAGDYYPSGKVNELIRGCDFDSVFSDIKKITEKVDYSVVNLECPATEAPEPISKIGPALKCGAEALDALEYAGFDCVTLANNHINDFGPDGILETLSLLDARDIDHVGAGKDREDASKVFLKDVGGTTLAIINCCEREFSIAGRNTPGAAELDPVTQVSQIRFAKDQADYVVVIVHGGYERCEYPSPRMVRTYRAFVDAGADAVINHHQHCCSGYEVYSGKPIFYGIGNFCFEPLKPEGDSWHKGFLVELDLGEEAEPVFKLIPFSQCLEQPGPRLLDEESSKSFLSRISGLNGVIADPEALENEYYAFLDRQAYVYKGAFALPDKLARRLARIGIIRPFLSKKKGDLFIDYVGCDAHRDGLLRFLDKNRRG